MPTPPRDTAHFSLEYRDKQLLPAFQQAYGEFIRQFGQTENTLTFRLEQFVLRLLGERDLQKDIVRALLGSRRTPEIANATKLCLKAAIKAGSDFPKESLENVSVLFAQVAEIRFLRDRTAHYAIHPWLRSGENAYFRTLNRYTVNDLERTEEILFQIEDLEAATEDLKAICNWSMFVLNLQIPDAPIELGRQPSWQYKPSSLIRTPYQELPYD